MENKQDILNKLLPALQATRQFNDLASLEYNAEYETVKATFTTGYYKTANVAADSGIAMIKDVIKQIL